MRVERREIDHAHGDEEIAVSLGDVGALALGACVINGVDHIGDAGIGGDADEDVQGALLPQPESVLAVIGIDAAGLKAESFEEGLGRAVFNEGHRCAEYLGLR